MLYSLHSLKQVRNCKSHTLTWIFFASYDSLIINIETAFFSRWQTSTQFITLKNMAIIETMSSTIIHIHQIQANGQQILWISRTISCCSPSCDPACGTVMIFGFELIQKARNLFLIVTKQFLWYWDRQWKWTKKWTNKGQYFQKPRTVDLHFKMTSVEEKDHFSTSSCDQIQWLVKLDKT